MLFVEGIQFLLRQLDLGLDPVFQELVENQLLFVALGAIADAIVLVESQLARFLHEQFAGDKFVEKEPFPSFLLISCPSSLCQFTPANVKFSLCDLPAVDKCQYTFVWRWRTADEQ